MEKLKLLSCYFRLNVTKTIAFLKKSAISRSSLVILFLVGSICTSLTNLVKAKNSTIESVLDFLIKLEMKPYLHLVEISIFSLNHFIVRVTKVMNNLLDYIKNCTFKVIFLR